MNYVTDDAFDYWVGRAKAHGVEWNSTSIDFEGKIKFHTPYGIVLKSYDELRELTPIEKLRDLLEIRDSED